MLLASSALLYVVASTLPKTSYLTTMDKFVLVNLLTQFCVAVVSWFTCGVFFPVSTDAANTVNLAAFVVLFVYLMASTVVILGRPIFHNWMAEPRAWPDTLSRDEPSTRYFPFETFVNVFPPWAPGGKNPVALPEKTYRSGGVMVNLPLEMYEPHRISISALRKSRQSFGTGSRRDLRSSRDGGRQLLSANT